MTTPQWPPGTFGWLAQIFNAAVNAKLLNEGNAIIELIVSVAPHYRGRALLDSLLLYHTQRYQEAAQGLADLVSADPGNDFARYLLYMSLWAMDNHDWVQHAQALAAAGHEELSPLAQAKLSEAGRATDDISAPAKADESASLAAAGVQHLLMRV